MNNTERLSPAPDASPEQLADVIDITSREKITVPTQEESKSDAVNRVRSIADFKAQLLAQKPVEVSTATRESGTVVQHFNWNETPVAPAESVASSVVDTTTGEVTPATTTAETAPTSSESEQPQPAETNETATTPETNEQEAIKKALETVRKAGYAVTRIVEQQAQSETEPASRSVGAILESDSSAAPDTTPDRTTLLGRLSGYFADAHDRQNARRKKREAKKLAKLNAKALKKEIKANNKAEKEAYTINRQLKERENLQAFMKQRAERREQLIAKNKEQKERSKAQRDLERQEVKDLGKNILNVFRRNATPSTESEPTGSHSTAGNENAENFADMMARKSTESNENSAPVEQVLDTEQEAQTEQSPAYPASTSETIPLEQTPAQYTAAEFNPNLHYPGFSQEELDAASAKTATPEDKAA